MDKYEALYRYFGYSSFHEGQEEIIDAVLANRDALCVMPTGSGKSLCYQLPAVMMSGVALVVSPLIALMKDQVDQLTRNGIRAAYINSSLTGYQQQMVISRARNGEYQIIYIAPERLEVEGFVELAMNIDISLIAVDEAHCVSQWGQDFRPCYLKIADFIDMMQKAGRRPPVCALTATATGRVRGDIIELLQLRNAVEAVTSFDRPNLRFEVIQPQNRKLELLKQLKSMSGLSGIVYCLTTKTVMELCEWLGEKGIPAVPYHGKLPNEVKTASQNDFIYDRCNIIVATNAFGMGINKSNVSFVIHYNMPRDIESYYQEAGRAGRDGESARCVLLYSPSDIYTNRFLMEHSGEDNENMSPEQLEEKRRMDNIRLNNMISYCQTASCLRAYILRYFGERPPENCGNCSSCSGIESGALTVEEIDVTIDAQKIISCVIRMKLRGMRFGKSMIADVLLGAESERISRFRLAEIKTYGAMRGGDKETIGDLIEYLVRSDYLTMCSLPDSRATVVDEGPCAAELLRPGAKLIYKKVLRKEQPAAEKKNEKQLLSALPQVMQELYEQLRTMRTTIAADEGVPPYVIMNNSVLRELSVRLPASTDELYDVPGIGSAKVERYGDRVLSVIRRFAAANGDRLEEAMKLLPAVPEPAETLSTSRPKKEKKPGKSLFDLTPEQREAVEISDEPVGVNVIARAMNEQIDRDLMKGVTGQHINDWLVAEGLLEVVERGGVKQKRPTEKGRQMGVTEEEHCFSETGRRYMMNMFSREAQRYIINNYQ